jgi:hypothetical protein
MRKLWLKLKKRYYEWRMTAVYDQELSLKLDAVIKELEVAENVND